MVLAVFNVTQAVVVHGLGALSLRVNSYLPLSLQC